MLCYLSINVLHLTTMKQVRVQCVWEDKVIFKNQTKSLKSSCEVIQKQEPKRFSFPLWISALWAKNNLNKHDTLWVSSKFPTYRFDNELAPITLYCEWYLWFQTEPYTVPRWKEQHETEVAEGEATVCAVSFALNQVGGRINIPVQSRRLWRMQVWRGQFILVLLEALVGKRWCTCSEL